MELFLNKVFTTFCWHPMTCSEDENMSDIETLEDVQEEEIIEKVKKF